MDSQKQVFKCLGNGCEKTLQTLSGGSKHHKKCSYQRQVSEKHYIVIEESNKVKCKRCYNLFNVASKWYKHNQNNPYQPEKEKTKKIHKCIICSKEFDRYSKLN